jgi:hypothetical protein
VLPLLLGGLLVVGLLWVGQQANQALRQRGRPFPFAGIACDPPGNQSRREFLVEVQYLAGLPDQLDLLDPDLSVRLVEAFARHPWVARVERVEKHADQIQVVLRHRSAALRIRLAGPPNEPGGWRAVDGEGVLLPASAEVAGLPVWEGVTTLPPRPGLPCPDPGVVAAARTVAWLRRQEVVLGEGPMQVSMSQDGIVLEGSGWQVLWGSPPGEEHDGEAKAEDKVRRWSQEKGRGPRLDLRRGPA